MVVVITGANQGLGYFAALTLAAAPSTPATDSIVFACRNVAAANVAADAIAAKTGCARSRLVVLPEPLNLSELPSVRAYAAALRAWLGDRPITSLVNNAGVGGSHIRSLNSQGREMIFATNHIGHFLLTLLLLPAMATGGRIVNVASDVHDPDAKTPIPDPGLHFPATPAEYDERMLLGLEGIPSDSVLTSGGRRYSRSKLANVMFTFELARRLSGAAPHGVEAAVAAKSSALPGTAGCTLPTAKSLTVVAMNPGGMLDTGFVTNLLGRVVGAIMWALIPVVRWTPIGALLRSAPVSGAHLAEVSLGKGSGGVDSAVYYDGATVKNSSLFSRAEETVVGRQQELWAHSLRWAAVTDEELAVAGLK